MVAHCQSRKSPIVFCGAGWPQHKGEVKKMVETDIFVKFPLFSNLYA